MNKGRTCKATGRAISVQARHRLQRTARSDKEGLRDSKQPTARQNRRTGGLGGPLVAQALPPQDWPGPQSPSQPQAGGSLGHGCHRAGSTLPPSANSRRGNHRLCSALPDTTVRLRSQGAMLTGQSTDGVGSQQSTQPQSGTRGRRGQGHGKSMGRRQGAPLHQDTGRPGSPHPPPSSRTKARAA